MRTTLRPLFARYFWSNLVKVVFPEDGGLRSRPIWLLVSHLSMLLNRSSEMYADSRKRDGKSSISWTVYCTKDAHESEHKLVESSMSVNNETFIPFSSSICFAMIVAGPPFIPYDIRSSFVCSSNAAPLISCCWSMLR